MNGIIKIKLFDSEGEQNMICQQVSKVILQETGYLNQILPIT